MASLHNAKYVRLSMFKLRFVFALLYGEVEPIYLTKLPTREPSKQEL